VYCIINNVKISSDNKMKNINYHTDRTVPKTNGKIVEWGTVDILTHKYVTTHFTDFIQTL